MNAVNVANAPELARLRDIHLPMPLGWWPLAPGWYLLLAFFCLSFMALYGFSRRKLADGAAKRQAQIELARIEREHQQDNNSQRSSAQVSQLLKRVALAYYSREQVAAIQGEDWLHFLSQSGNNLDFTTVRQALLEYPYQPPRPCDLTRLFKLSKDWINLQNKRRARQTCLS